MNPLVLLLLTQALAPADLSIVGTVPTGPAMDVAVAGSRAVVIGGGRLHLLDIGSPGRPTLIGSLAGLGNTRQVAVAGPLAFVSSREAGLFVVDIAEAQPRLVSHYDTLELATGVVLAGDVLFVAQRHYGVELIDVRDPARLRHLSTLRTGEAQSVAYHDGLLYTGVWGTAEVVVADVRDPRQPRIVSRLPLDGYGDGVAVVAGRLYAATGHHARAPHARPEDPGYGAGHGLEVFSLAEPGQPRLLGRVKFPRFYAIGFDMWSVKVVGTIAFVGDTHNGLFTVDVSQPAAPRIIARLVLPKPSATAEHADYVGGFGLVNDHVYLAGGATGLHVVAAKDLARPCLAEPSAPPAIGPSPSPSDNRRFRPDGQVHAVATRGDLAVVACGADGLHTVRLGERLTPLHHRPSQGVVTDVCLAGERVYAAEGSAGLSVWQLGADGALVELGRYRPDARTVRYVAVPEPGRLALVEVGANTLHIVDVSDPSRPRLALADAHLGLLYGRQMADQLVAGRLAAVFWHVSGLHWYDLGGQEPVYAGQRSAGSFDPLAGLATTAGRLLTTRRGGLLSLPPDETRPLDSLPVGTVPGHRLAGQVAVSGSIVAVTNRAWGDVWLLDAADPQRPALLGHTVLDGNPGRAAFTPSGWLVPAGYEGLLLCDPLPWRRQ